MEGWNVRHWRIIGVWHVNIAWTCLLSGTKVPISKFSDLLPPLPFRFALKLVDSQVVCYWVLSFASDTRLEMVVSHIACFVAALLIIIIVIKHPQIDQRALPRRCSQDWNQHYAIQTGTVTTATESTVCSRLFLASNFVTFLFCACAFCYGLETVRSVITVYCVCFWRQNDILLRIRLIIWPSWF